MKNISFLLFLIFTISCTDSSKRTIDFNSLTTPEIVDFQIVPLNTNSIMTINISNPDDAISVVVNLESPDFSIIYSNCSNLKRGKSCSLKVLMNTKTPGEKSATLSVNDNDISLLGEVESPEAMPSSIKISESAIEIEELDFSQVLQNSNPIKTILIENLGPKIDILSKSISGDFQILSSGCGATLNLRSSCSIKIIPIGNSLGIKTGVLTILDKEIDLSAEIIPNNIGNPNELSVISDSEVIPDDLDLGQINRNLLKVLTIKNETGSPIGPLEPIFSASAFIKLFDTCLNATLLPRRTCIIKYYIGNVPDGEYSVDVSLGDKEFEIKGVIGNPVCPVDQHLEGENCVDNIIACSIIPNGALTGHQIWNGSAYGACIIDTCQVDYTLYDNTCYENEIACLSLPHGAEEGNQYYDDNGLYGSCQISSCLEGYQLVGNSCEELQIVEGAIDFDMDINFHCYINGENKVYCTGLQEGGRLGNGQSGANTWATSPQAVVTSGVLNGKDIVKITVGFSGVSVLDSDGKAYSWGLNGAEGRLGNGTSGAFTDQSVPVKVVDTGVLAGKKLVDISKGALHTCALDEDGKAYCWGGGNQGQLGNNNTANASAPVKVVDTGVLAGKKLVKIRARFYTTYAIDENGEVYAWGQGSSEALLGNGVTGTSSMVPVKATIGVFSTKPIKDVGYASALTVDGEIWGWGRNHNGELGTGSNSPNMYTSSMVKPAGVMTGGTFETFYKNDHEAGGIAVDSNGNIYYYGRELTGGAAGAPGGFPAYSPKATLMTGALDGKTIIDAKTDGHASCALDDEGNLYCWGRNNNAKLGLGHGTTPVAYPQIVILP